MNDEKRPTRILIVEDHDLLADSLTASLRAQGLAAHAAKHATADEVVALAADLRPGIVLLDLELGEKLGSGLDLIGPLRELDASVVMLTGVTDRVRLAECVEAGAVGVLNKSVSFDDLIAGVHQAVNHGSVLSAHQHEDMLDELRRHRARQREAGRPFESLTERERAVLSALMGGKSAHTIAGESFVSVATVRSQIHAVLTKLGVNSQLAAVAKAREAGWHDRSADE